MSLEFRLTWPDPELSPNARVCWRKLARHKKAYRLSCCKQVLAQHQVERRPIPSGPLRLELVFYPHTRRSMDLDNLVARMKSGIDGMCDALGIDDKRFPVVSGRLSPDIGAYVRVIITEYSE